MLPKNIKNYLTELFLSVGFSQKETEEKLVLIEENYQTAILARVLKKIPKEKQEKAAEDLKKAKDPEDFFLGLLNFFGNSLTRKDLEQIYEEELTFILKQFLKPFGEKATSEQLAKLQKVTAKYF